VRNRRCGHRFYRQVPAGQYILDFNCPHIRFAIEVDGDVHLLPHVKARNADREAALTEELKLSILRLTNEEVLGEADETLSEKIRIALNSAAKSAPPWNERPARRR
jgi:very-short-patch-repair endonuclease